MITRVFSPVKVLCNGPQEDCNDPAITLLFVFAMFYLCKNIYCDITVIAFFFICDPNKLVYLHVQIKSSKVYFCTKIINFGVSNFSECHQRLMYSFFLCTVCISLTWE